MSVAVELTADYEHKQVVVRHVGKKSSATGSRELSLGDTVCLGSGDTLCLLPAKYEHAVKFRDTNSSWTESSTAVTGRKHCADDVGISSDMPSKRHRAFVSSASANSDEEQDSDTDHVEMVREINMALILTIIITKLHYHITAVGYHTKTR